MLRHYSDFNVFQLMRLLLAGATPDLPLERILRFRADLSASFPANEFSQIRLIATSNDADVTKDLAGHTAEISTPNYCIASVLGPLPEPFTEWLRDLLALRSTAMADFLDIFNQRFNILRYQLKLKQTIALQSVPPEQTEVAYGIAALMGLTQPQQVKQVPLPVRSWLGLAGLMANRRKQASTIVQVLSLALGVQVRLIPFVGSWLHIAPEDRCALGQRNHQLGRNSVIGHRVWDQQSRVRLHIGVIDYDQLCSLLPSTPLQQHVLAKKSVSAKAQRAEFDMFDGLVRLLLDRQADCEVEFAVNVASIPAVRLAQPAHERDFSSMRLGQTAWLNSHAVNLRLGQTAWLNSHAVNPMTTRHARYLINTTQGLR